MNVYILIKISPRNIVGVYTSEKAAYQEIDNLLCEDYLIEEHEVIS